jgi:hypothetical protein
MKKLIAGLAASCCGLMISASALAEPFPDGTVQAGYMIEHNGWTTCPPAMDVIGTKIITDPGYPWTVVPVNFENLKRASTEISFVGAGMDRNVAKCFYKVNNDVGSPGVVLIDNQHFLQLSPTPVCDSYADNCVFFPNRVGLSK